MGVTMFDFLSDKLGYHTKLYVILPGCVNQGKSRQALCICCMAVEETARTGSGFLPLSGMRRKKLCSCHAGSGWWMLLQRYENMDTHIISL